ncbi:MAG: hypothetical protein E6Q58_02405 [Niabella sp.]|nr:MAG: hypothetical protein E6Q58_02405 [Niabella sp.]
MLQAIETDKYITAIEKITKAQGKIVGEEIATEMANTVEGIHIVNNKIEVHTLNPKETLEALIKQYSNLFGLISVQVSKDAIKTVEASFTPDELPEILK